MANVRIKYKVPTTRVDGKPLAQADIAGVQLLMSADNGQNFSLLDTNPPTAGEFLQTELEAGTYVFRLVVIDKQSPALSSTPVDASASITAAAPSPVSDVVVTVE